MLLSIEHREFPGTRSDDLGDGDMIDDIASDFSGEIQHHLDDKNSFIDLYESKVILAYKSENSWLSIIESVYFDYDSNKYLLLTKNCQTENVSDKTGIYEGKRATFRQLVTNTGTITMRSGSGIHHPYSSDLTKFLHYSESDAVLYRCGLMILDGRAIEFDEMRSMLLRHENLGHVHVRFDWTDETGRKALLSRCEYMNFNYADQDRVSFDYVQPTCGEVAVFDRSRCRLAYVAALVGRGGTFHSEMILEDEVSYFDTKKGFLGDRSAGILSFLMSFMKRIFMTDYYTDRRKIDAEVTFYITDPKNEGSEIVHVGPDQAS